MIFSSVHFSCAKECHKFLSNGISGIDTTILAERRISVRRLCLLTSECGYWLFPFLFNYDVVHLTILSISLGCSISILVNSNLHLLLIIPNAHSITCRAAERRLLKIICDGPTFDTGKGLIK